MIESVGAYGYTVGIWKRDGSPNLYLRWNRRRWKSLGHADLEAAREEAKRRAAALLAPRGVEGGRRPRLGELLTLYELQVTPTKTGRHAANEDKRRIALWTHVLGAQLDPERLTGTQLKAFQRARAAGTIRLPEHELKPARAKTIREDLVFLKAVFNWAASMQSGWLLDRNPMKGYELPRELNPRTPRAYWEDYVSIQRVAKSKKFNPLFAPFMQLVESLGWRVTAICELRVSDFDPVPGTDWPHGRLLKRAESDKVGVQRWTTINADARAALKKAIRITRRVGDQWIFPAVKNPRKPWSRHYPAALLEEAYRVAKVPEAARVKFHAWRRTWVDVRKHLSRADVAAQGAWLNQRTLEIYERPDAETLLAVAEEPRKLRRRRNV